MKDLIIVGAGGFGREALYIAKDINKVEPTWNILGFIDDNQSALDGIPCDYKIIGTISDWQPQPGQYFAMGVASPKAKEALATKLKARGAEFATLISPYARIWDFFKCGEGCVISGSIGDNVTLGNFVHIAGSMIGQDTVIEDYSTTTGYTNIATAHIGKRVFVGSHAAVIGHKKVGDDAMIAAGSIVFNNVKPGTKVMGYPAKKIQI